MRSTLNYKKRTKKFAGMIFFFFLKKLTAFAVKIFNAARDIISLYLDITTTTRKQSFGNAVIRGTVMGKYFHIGDLIAPFWDMAAVFGIPKAWYLNKKWKKVQHRAARFVTNNYCFETGSLGV